MSVRGKRTNKMTTFRPLELDEDQVAADRNLIRLLHEHLGKALADVYATNLFPLIKPRGMSEPIGHEAMLWAAKEFGIQHIKILTPRLVIILGGATFDALSEVARHPIRRSMSVAIESPFEFNGSYLWCQAHTGGLGIRNRGGIKRVNSDWQKMAAWYRKPRVASVLRTDFLLG